jgi:hypothetical protein
MLCKNFLLWKVFFCCVFGDEQKRCQDLDGREKGIQGLLTTGQEMMDSTQPDHVNQVAEKLKKLKDRWQETRDRAIKRKVTALLKPNFIIFHEICS